jgi:hypothetical protein
MAPIDLEEVEGEQHRELPIEAGIRARSNESGTELGAGWCGKGLQGLTEEELSAAARPSRCATRRTRAFDVAD